MKQLKGLLRLLDENEAVFVESLGKDLRKPVQASMFSGVKGRSYEN
jgi:hypothetical protein